MFFRDIIAYIVSAIRASFSFFKELFSTDVQSEWHTVVISVVANKNWMICRRLQFYWIGLEKVVCKFHKISSCDITAKNNFFEQKAGLRISVEITKRLFLWYKCSA